LDNRNVILIRTVQLVSYKYKWRLQKVLVEQNEILKVEILVAVVARATYHMQQHTLTLSKSIISKRFFWKILANLRGKDYPEGGRSRKNNKKKAQMSKNWK